MKTLAALTALLLASAVALSTPAAAHQMPTQHVRGQITAADDSSITVKTRAGATVRLAFAPDPSVTSLMKADFSEVKVGTYIGSAAVPLRPATRTCSGSGCKEPKLTALELRIFPESMKGAGEGQREWVLTPDSRMTNGMVDDVEGRVLSIKYKGNDVDMHVPTNAPVVNIGSGDKGLLKPGALIFGVAQKGADGNLTALRISAGSDGLIPPM